MKFKSYVLFYQFIIFAMFLVANNGCVSRLKVVSDQNINGASKKWFDQVIAKSVVITDTAYLESVTCVTNRLLWNSAQPPEQWEIAIIEEPEFGISVMPPGYIVASSGVFNIVTTEEELAGVLAGAIADVETKNIYKRINNARVQAIINAALNDNQSGNSNYYRELIFDTDKAAMLLLLNAGYDAGVYPKMLSIYSELTNVKKEEALLYKERVERSQSLLLKMNKRHIEKVPCVLPTS